MLGFIVGRWWAAIAAALGWTGLAIFLIVNNGWYGAGWGDGGILLNVLSAAATVGGAAIGVAVRRLTRDPRRT